MPHARRAMLLRRAMVRTMVRIDLEIALLASMLATALAVGGLAWILRATL